MLFADGEWIGSLRGMGMEIKVIIRKLVEGRYYAVLFAWWFLFLGFLLSKKVIAISKTGDEH